MPLPIGRPFDCGFGEFVPRLRFLSDSDLELGIPTPSGRATEVVATQATEVRPDVFMLSWIEANGTTVVHLQDFERRVVLSHARLPDGTLLRSNGTIEWVK